MGITVKDLKSIIKDSVSSSLAARMVDAEQETRDLFEAELKKGSPEFTARFRAMLAGDRKPLSDGEKLERAASFRVETDPHKGKGLDFARAVRCITLARKGGGTLTPADVARSIADQGAPGYQHVADVLGDASKRALEAGTLSAGGVFVPENLSAEFIELLYNATLASRLGARDLGFQGNLTLGRMNSGATVGYVGEEENITPSQPALGAVKLTGKKAAGLVPITNDLLRLASPGADAMVRDDLMMAMALRRDLSFYRGTGVDRQPKGVYSWISSGQKFNQTGTTLAAVVADFCQLARLVEESNIAGLESAAYVMAPRTFWGLAKLLDSNGNFVFMPMLMAGNLFGFRFGKSMQIPTNLSGSNSETYFGVHSDVILGRDESTPTTVEMEPNGAYHNGSAVVAGFSNDTTPVRIIEAHDVAARHNNTFAVLEAQTLS